MREYTTLTREAVDVVEGAAQYMSETTPMEHWSDKMLDLLLNGPTINGIKKDEVRALLRQTYAALKRYEVIGPMASPFMNDPTAIVALAFRELYPRLEYYAQYVPGLEDEEGKPAYGLTIFPDDGSTPIVCISAEVPISAGPELLAHELAHVAAGEAVEHGPEWKAAEEAIFQKYNEILDAKIPDEPVEVTVTPHEVGDDGILAMPLKANIPDPQRDDWKLVTCPICGAECWENDLARQAMAAEPELRAACTTCALKAGVTTGSVFLSKNKTPLDRSTVWRRMKALCERAGVDPRKVFPHSLRHLFARTFYQASRDVVKLADILGHSSVETTRIYLISTGEEHAQQLEQLRLVG